MPDPAINRSQSGIAVTKESFLFLCELIKKHTGIALTEDKSYLLETRLFPIIKRDNYGNINQLVNALRLADNHLLRTEIIEAMTNNETSFFRDLKPFAQLTDMVIPHLLKNRQPGSTIRILNAACSSGQEPYSIAMSILDKPKFSQYKFEIIAGDVDQYILKRAMAGNYSQFEVQRGLPITMLLKYFTQDGDNWNINDKVKSMVSFRQLNLLEDVTTLDGKFDIIFCRNVLIYFDQPTKSQILHKLSQIMSEHAILFLGCSESSAGLCDQLTLFENTSWLAQLAPEC